MMDEKMKTGFISTFALGLLAISCSDGWSAPFDISFSGQTIAAGIPGSSTNFSLVVTVDNGNTTAASQTWTQTDFVSALLSSGTYSEPYDLNSSSFLPHGEDFSFQTDGTGTLTAASISWLDSSTPAFDGAQLFLGAGPGYFNTLGQVNFFTAGTVSALQTPADLTGFSSPTAVGGATPVPEPTSMAIWSLLGLAGTGYGWRRRRKVAQ